MGGGALTIAFKAFLPALIRSTVQSMLLGLFPPKLQLTSPPSFTDKSHLSFRIQNDTFVIRQIIIYCCSLIAPIGIMLLI